MAAKPETYKRYSALVARFGKLSPACKTTCDKLERFTAALKDAVKQRDETSLQLQSKAVKVEYDRTSEVQKQVGAAIEELAEIEKDDDFVVSENKKLAVLSKELERLRDRLEDALASADYALADGSQRAETMRKERLAGHQGMVVARDAARKMRDYVLAAGKAIDLRLKAARDAAERRDPDGFSKELKAAESSLDTAKKTFDSFSKSHDDRCAVWAKEPWFPGPFELPVFEEARAAAFDAGNELKRVERESAKVAALKPKPIDFTKAAKLLGLDKEVSKVRKALEASPNVRGQLDNLSRMLGLKKSGGQLYDDLRKAQIL